MSKLPPLYDYIQDYNNASNCRTYLLGLLDLSIDYCADGFASKKEYWSKLSYTKDLSDNNFNLHKLKLSILDGIDVECKYSIKNNRRCGNIFIMAMLYGRLDIVKHFLNHGFPYSVNCRILNSQQFPTYGMLALGLNDPQLISCVKRSLKADISWFGINSGFLMALKGSYTRNITYLPAGQYFYISKSNGYDYKSFNNNFLIVEADFICMKEDTKKILSYLKIHNGGVRFSKCCYLLQSNLDICFKLYEYKADVFQIMYGMTPIHFSAIRNSIEGIIFFMKTGLSLNSSDDKHRSPLFHAYKNKNYPLCKFMLDYGAEIDFFVFAQEDTFEVTFDNLEEAEKLVKTKSNLSQILCLDKDKPNALLHLEHKYGTKEKTAHHIIYSTTEELFEEHKNSIAFILNQKYDKQYIKTIEEKIDKFLNKEKKKTTSFFTQKVITPLFTNINKVKTKAERLTKYIFPPNKKMIPSDSYYLMKQRINEQKVIEITKKK
ncbi:Ankyrin repeat containing protein [Spraguea lophii 42_110]|uniref:Ankyrin repeat containing protein n=1 Tax=Spraguea lophii (strain 42_110) TaxID=1358809 RepID=S7XWB0_SPRLO|nr:Ankyrin repeat containing protein [Spraguea lophii 42_110]